MTADAPPTAAETRQGSPARAAGRQGTRHRRAADEADRANHTQLAFSVGQTRVEVLLPPVDKLAFYAGLAGAAAFGLVEWPIAALTGLGHLLSDDRRSRTLHALGEALDGAA